MKSTRSLISIICFFVASAAFAQMGKPQPAPDEALDAGFDAFYSIKQKKVADRTNAAVGLAGINAPKGVDIFSFGRAEIDQAKKDAELAATYSINASFSKPTSTPLKKKEVTGGLRFEASDTERECLQALSNASAIQPHAECASTKVVHALWSKNALLLARYHAISQLPHFQGDFSNGQVLLDMSKLIAADIYLEVERGNTEAAYRKWKSNHQFMRLVKGSEGTWVEKAIFLIAEAFSLNSIELILHSDRRIAAKRADELLQLLKPTGIAYWNVPAIFRTDYVLLMEPLITALGNINQPTNFIRNRFIRSANAFVAASQAHPSVVGERIEKVQAAYPYQPQFTKELAEKTKLTPSEALQLTNKLFLVVLIPQTLRGKELVVAFHQREERSRALSLAVMITQKNISDKNVANFLATVDHAYRSAFTDKPFEWVADQRLIRFVDPKGKSSFDVRL